MAGAVALSAAQDQKRVLEPAAASNSADRISVVDIHNPKSAVYIHNMTLRLFECLRGPSDGWAPLVLSLIGQGFVPDTGDGWMGVWMGVSADVLYSAEAGAYNNAENSVRYLFRLIDGAGGFKHVDKDMWNWHIDDKRRPLVMFECFLSRSGSCSDPGMRMEFIRSIVDPICTHDNPAGLDRLVSLAICTMSDDELSVQIREDPRLPLCIVLLRLAFPTSLGVLLSHRFVLEHVSTPSFDAIKQYRVRQKGYLAEQLSRAASKEEKDNAQKNVDHFRYSVNTCDALFCSAIIAYQSSTSAAIDSGTSSAMPVDVIRIVISHLVPEPFAKMWAEDTDSVAPEAAGDGTAVVVATSDTKHSSS